jgi:CubicO group peptidase (beta-lactamase class C family)
MAVSEVVQSAAKLGFSANRLARIGERIQHDLDAQRYCGISIIVARHGEIVVDHAEGWADQARGVPVGRDTVFSLMSLSKAITTMLTLRLVEDGHLRLTTPLSTWIPELGEKQAEINVYHVLTQTSGLPAYTPDAGPDVIADLERYAATTFGLVPASRPGERVAYSVRVAHSVLGLFLERLMGAPFTELVQRWVLEPIGLRDTSFGPREDLLPRIAPIVPAPYLDANARAEVTANVSLINDFSLRPGAVVPGSNAFATVSDVHRLAEALRTGRGADGEPVLSPAMIELVSRNHTGTMPNDILDDVFAGRNLVQYPAYLAMGFWGRGPGMTHTGYGHLTSPRTFGAMGRGSAMFWIDPLLDMTMTVLSTGLMDETDNFERLSVLSDLAVSSLVDRAPFDLFGPQSSREPLDVLA